MFISKGSYRGGVGRGVGATRVHVHVRQLHPLGICRFDEIVNSWGQEMLDSAIMLFCCGCIPYCSCWCSYYDIIIVTFLLGWCHSNCINSYCSCWCRYYDITILLGGVASMKHWVSGTMKVFLYHSRAYLAIEVMPKASCAQEIEPSHYCWDSKHKVEYLCQTPPHTSIKINYHTSSGKMSSEHASVISDKKLIALCKAAFRLVVKTF